MLIAALIAVAVVVAATSYSRALEELLPTDNVVDGWPCRWTLRWSRAPGRYSARLNPAALPALRPGFIVEADEVAADIVAHLAPRKRSAGR